MHIESALEHQHISVDGVQLHVVMGGPKSGPLVVLLHGFPESWRAFARQIDPLVRAGFRVLAPDQRGYGESDKPQGIASYPRPRLAKDVGAMVHAVGRQRCALVGHDWGGLVAWDVAIAMPALVEQLVILNAPQGEVARRSWRTLPRQMLRSWYAVFMQLPWLPERLLSGHDAAALWHVLQRLTPPATFDAEDERGYRAAWTQPDAVASMLAWYRAEARLQLRPLESLRVTCPTLVLWGTPDPALEPALAHASAALAPTHTLVFLEGAGHFVQHTRPDEVNAQLLRFLQDANPRAATDAA